MVHVSSYLKDNLKRFRRKEDGQALMEFALIAPILIMLAVGILLLGYFLYSHIIVVSAANQGARAGSALSADPDTPQHVVINTARTTAESMLSQGLNIDYGDVTVRTGTRFEVEVTYEFRFPIGLPGLPTSHTIKHTSTYHVWGDG